MPVVAPEETPAVAAPESAPATKPARKRSSKKAAKKATPETQTAPAVEEDKTVTTKTAKKSSKPRAAKSTKAAKSTEEKAPKEEAKATEKKPTRVAAPKDALRKPQIRVMELLSKDEHANGLTREKIAELATVDNASLTGYIGSTDDAKREAHDEKYYKTLISHKYVRAEKHDVEGKDVYFYKITAAGKKQIERIQKAAEKAAK